jgi:beta-glucosidase
LDNYEWAFGFNERFGLIEINYETQERIVRTSALRYKELIAEKQASEVDVVG